MKTLYNDLLSSLLTLNPECRINPIWLLRSQGRLNASFARRARVSRFEEEGGISRVVINNESYFWPQNSPVEVLLQVIAELKISEHPHQYLWGPTRIRKGDVCLDIGTCEGAFAAHAASLGASVVCVEPSKTNTSLIKTLFAHRGLPQPLIAQVLLGSQTGTQWFHDNIENPGGSKVCKEAGAYEVPMMTCDELVKCYSLKRVDFIKCDAEGMDVEIVKGARQTLRQYRPRLAITTYHDPGDYRRMARYLKELGYRIRGKGFLRVGGRLIVNMLHAW